MQGSTSDSEVLPQTGQGDGSSAHEAGKLAVDRAVACHLLQIVYDASPLVRAEVALSLSRLISGHNVMFQVGNPRTCRSETRGSGSDFDCVVVCIN